VKVGESKAPGSESRIEGGVSTKHREYRAGIALGNRGDRAL